MKWDRHSSKSAVGSRLIATSNRTTQPSAIDTRWDETVRETVCVCVCVYVCVCYCVLWACFCVCVLQECHGGGDEHRVNMRSYQTICVLKLKSESNLLLAVTVHRMCHYLCLKAQTDTNLPPHWKINSERFGIWWHSTLVPHGFVILYKPWWTTGRSLFNRGVTIHQYESEISFKVKDTTTPIRGPSCKALARCVTVTFW